jgi:hypothetical protein
MWRWITEKRKATAARAVRRQRENKCDKGDLMFLNNYKQICDNAAQRWGVNAEIHPDDFIFHFLFDNPTFQSKEMAIEYYFDDGFSSAQKLLSVLKEICGFDGEEKLSLLEFASGYGCVTRHIRNVIPFSITTACDIHQEAIQFIREKLETEAVLSASRPEDLHLNRAFDVVFALSFFSHMPKATWTRWFNTLLSKVKKGGFFIFTTQGWLSRKYFGFPEFDNDGFWFAKDSEQKDLDTADYGSTVVTPSFVFQQAAQNPDGGIVLFREGYWWKHQDLFIVKHDSDPRGGGRHINLSQEVSQLSGTAKIQFEQLEADISEKDVCIRNLESLLKERETTLNSIYKSRGWKALLMYYKLRDRILY